MAAAPSPAFKAGKRLIPLLNRVLIKKTEAPKQSKGGIVLPENAKSKILTGTVISIGPGSHTESGQPIKMSVQPGDNVILPDYGGTKINIEEGEDYFLYRESEILAKVIE